MLKIPFIHDIFEFISSNSLGPIPMDIIAHLVLSTLIYVVLTKYFRLKFLASFAIILALALAKEIYDLPRLSSTPAEHFKDIAFSIIVPGFSGLFRARERRQESQRL